MKICLICCEYPPGPHGGIGTIVQLSARKFAKAGHDVKVIGIYDNAYGGADYFIDQGVEVYRLRQKQGKLSFILPWFRQFRQIKKWVDEGEVELIEAPESRGWFAFWPKLTVPCILRAHGSETNEKMVRGLRPNRLTKLLETLSYRRADAASATSEYSKKSSEELFSPRYLFKVIPEGVEFLEVPQLPRLADNVVFAGTLNENKGTEVLVRAAVQLLQSGMNFTLELYGKDYPYKGGSMIGHLKSLIPAPFEKQIKFKGHVTREELFKVYSVCTLAVFPSKVEAFGLAPVEAMMCGCAVIHSDIPTGRELIEDGKSGLLVDPYDVGMLASKIRLLLTDIELNTQLGSAARARVKSNFSVDVMCHKLLEFYNEVIIDFRNKNKL